MKAVNMKNNPFIRIFLICSLTLASLGATNLPEQPTPTTGGGRLDPATLTALVQTGQVLPDEVVVQLQASTSLTALEQCAKLGGVTAGEKSASINFQVIRFSQGSLADVLPAIQNCPGVVYAEPNYVIHMTDTIPNDTYWSRQWGPINIRAPKGWDLSTGASTVTLAVIDTGVDLVHSDLATKIVSGYNFIDTSKPPQDDNGHGTHVAGIAAAITNNNYGVAGVSWGARIMPLKVLDSSGGGNFFDAANAITWAADHGAKVINMSFGSPNIDPTSSTYMVNAINYAYSKGLVMVAAAGNDGKNESFYPAIYNHVISVGATDSTNTRASFSNYGPNLDLMAPGVNVYSTYLNGFAYLSGTSMASPFVAGLASLLMGLPGVSNPVTVEQAMENSALDLGAAGRDNYYGYGLIQVDKAIQQLLPPGSFGKTSPANSASNQSTSLTLNWGSSLAATSYQYCLDTTNNNSCDTSWVSTGTIRSANVAMNSNTTYYWQVQALNLAGTTEADSSTWWHFTTKSCTTLTTSITPTTGGSIIPNPVPDCQAGTKFSTGTVVGLTASATSDYFRFLNWSGDVTGTSTASTITMDVNHSVTANFEQSTFGDVPFHYSETLGGVNYLLYPYIQTLWNGGYTAGCVADPLTYCPALQMDRAMSSVFMLRGNFGASYTPPPPPYTVFTADDWSQGPWAQPYAEGMWQAGLTAGCQQPPDNPQKLFCPWDVFTRAQAAVFGLRLEYGMDYGTPTNPVPPASGTVFADLKDTSTYPTAFAEKAYADGLLPACGTQGGKPLFCPDMALDRAWAAYLIVKSKALTLP